MDIGDQVDIERAVGILQADRTDRRYFCLILLILPGPGRSKRTLRKRSIFGHIRLFRHICLFCVFFVRGKATGTHDPGGNVDPALFHDTAAVGDALGRIMVSADDKYLQISPDKGDQKIVHQIDCLHGRNRFVIDIPCDHHRVGMF